MAQQDGISLAQQFENAKLEFSKHLSGAFRWGHAAASDSHSALWNGATTAIPIALVASRSVEDLRLALKISSDYGLPISVLAGGHDPSMRSLSNAGVVLDVRPLSSITFDPAKCLLTVGGGTVTGDIIRALPAEETIVTGTVRSVGLASFTMGGGYGRLNSYFGLALDQLEGAEMLLANGELVSASALHEPDLFWAIRGGGGNFGIATSLTYRVHSVPSLLSGLIFFPLANAKRALLNLQHEIDNQTEHMSFFSGFITSPEGEPVFLLAPLWIGDRETGEKVFKKLAGWDGAQVAQTGWSHYRDLFSDDFEKPWPKGGHYRLNVQSATKLNEDLAEALIAGASTFTSPMSAIVIHDFHGAAAEIPPSATAFPLRQNHYTLQIIGGWQAGDTQASRHQQWADELSQELSKFSLSGAYVNLLHPEESARVAAFYGESAKRLLSAKRRYDPNNVFTAPGALIAPQ